MSAARASAAHRRLLAGVALAALGLPIRAQAEPAPPAGTADAAKVEKLFELARDGRAVVRPQAAAKLAELGEPALLRVRQAAGATNADLALLGKDLVGVLGAFGDPALRARLWSALDDPDFPWRPDAARSLAEGPEPGERERFVRLAEDPLAPVRHAALAAFETLDLRGEKERVRALLADPSDRVRVRAAALLERWGEPSALYLLLEELARSDRFFELDTGGLARLAALELLRERLGDDAGFRADESPDTPANQTARAALAARIAERAPGDPPELPAIARAGGGEGQAVLGLELRSCRRGDYFLRWTADDRLLVGTGNAASLELSAGTTARLAEAARAHFEALGSERFWGQPGCDIEAFHWQAPGAEHPLAFQIAKGPERAPDLRPAALTELARALLATLPDEPDPDVRLDRLRSQVRAALEAVGGDPLAEAR